jgi:DNA invertase Pin-like site-specific DNA recombinase
MTKQPKRVAIYARVSTDDQTTDSQLLELHQVAERAGWEVVETYVDHAISGSKGRYQRPAFDRLHNDAAGRRFDLVMAWSVDRLGRSLQHLAGFLGELHALRIDLYLHQQHVDTTTPSGRALFGMMSVFAEFERAMIQERVRAGLARARAQGRRLGRPRIDGWLERRIQDALAKGDRGMLRIAADLGVGSGTVQRVKAAATRG